MEDVLAQYAKPYDPLCPLICFDERPCQILGDVLIPLPMKPGKPLRYDYEYERVGTANVFLFTEPLTGWRTLDVCEQRTGVDGAHQGKHLLEDYNPKAAAQCPTDWRGLVFYHRGCTPLAQTPLPTISRLNEY